jgi:hypothetical protein
MKAVELVRAGGSTKITALHPGTHCPILLGKTCSTMSAPMSKLSGSSVMIV